MEIELPYDPAIPVLDIYPEKMKTFNLKRYIWSVNLKSVHYRTIYNSQDMEAT